MTQRLVSIVLPTYNRAAILSRAIDSVLRQDYTAWELIVVDDGSRDGTDSVLAAYRDPRLKVVTHVANRGVTAAKNTGFDHISGDWFTVLDSDDEMLPEALSTMLSAADAYPDVDAVSCNCRNATTGFLSGTGIDQDGYVDMRTLVQMAGDHWGITRTSLLGSRRFDERIPGLEDVLWLKLSANSRRYYIHRVLKINHTEGKDRVSVQNKSRDRQLLMYWPLVDDEEYLAILESFDLKQYAAIVFSIVLSCVAVGQRSESWRFLRRYSGSWHRRVFLLVSCALGRRWVIAAYVTKDWVATARRWASRHRVAS
jgi:GalNAc5-diNAcBac-PP-undecaprenol beta-1,3-glucosyltransferase